MNGGEVLHSALRGTIAAAAMTGMRALTVSLGLVQEPPPQAIAERGGLLEHVPPDRRRAAIELAHWAYGAAGGVVYAFLPDRLRCSLPIGLAYGAGSWAVFEAVVAPRIGQKREGGRQQDLALLADHLLYGGVLARLAR